MSFVSGKKGMLVESLKIYIKRNEYFTSFIKLSKIDSNKSTNLGERIIIPQNAEELSPLS